MTMGAVERVYSRAPRWVKDTANVASRQYLMRLPGLQRPDFLIIGAKRGGTTSLFNYLVRHPGVLPLVPAVRGKKSTDFFFPGVRRSERWYLSHFATERTRRGLAADLGYRPISGEASPYYGWDARVAPEVRRVAPEVKAIMLLRDPVLRAWSHYHERVKMGTEPLSFSQALEAEDERLAPEIERMRRDPKYYSQEYDFHGYRSRGVYLPQIRTWLERFPREQLLVLRSEDLYDNTQQTFDEVCTFLGIPSVLMPTTSKFNAIAPAAETVPDESATWLRDFYAPHNRELADFLGRELSWQ
jgi:hypothetical protein